MLSRRKLAIFMYKENTEQRKQMKLQETFVTKIQSHEMSVDKLEVRSFEDARTFEVLRERFSRVASRVTTEMRLK